MQLSHRAKRSQSNHATASFCQFDKWLYEKKKDLTKYHLRIWRNKIKMIFLTRNSIEYYKHVEKCYKIEMKFYEKHAQLFVELTSTNFHMNIVYNMNFFYQKAMFFLNEFAKIRKELSNFKNDWLFNLMYQFAHSHLHFENYVKTAKFLKTTINDRRKILKENNRFFAKLIKFVTKTL